MTRSQLEMFLLNGGELGPVAPAGEADAYDLIVDAILGYGLVGRPRGLAAEMIRWMNAGAAPVLALDLPSGLGGEGGRPDADDVIRAECTLTLHMPKPGLEDPRAGRLFVADLGIPAGVTRRLGIDPPLYGPAFIAPLQRDGPP